MRYRIRRHLAHLIVRLLPAPLPAEPCRPTGRLEARRHSIRYSPACSLRPISSVHLIGSSPVPPHFPSCVPPSVPPRLLANPIHLIRLVPSHRLIAHISPQPNRMRRATSRRNGARDGQSKSHDIRYPANAPPRPPYSPYEPHDARALTRTRPRENAPSKPLTTPQTGNTGRRTRRDDGTPMLPACLPTRRRSDDASTRRHDNETQNATANCYPPYDTTTRDERRDEESGKRDGMSDGMKKNEPPLETRNGPKNETRYQIKRADCYSPSLLESSGKRGKSSNRER